MTSQLPPGGMVAPLMPMLLPSAAPPLITPGVAPAVHTMFGSGAALLVRLAGYGPSLKVTLDRVEPLPAGLVTVTLSCELPPGPMKAGVNDLARLGGPLTVAATAALDAANAEDERVWPL